MRECDEIEFSVEDRVELINSSDEDGPLIGSTGIVIAIDYGEERVAVDWKESEFNSGHDIGGRIIGNTGWWVPRRNIRYIDSTEIIPSSQNWEEVFL